VLLSYTFLTIGLYSILSYLVAKVITRFGFVGPQLAEVVLINDEDVLIYSMYRDHVVCFSTNC
jgi:hypothetical protein